MKRWLGIALVVLVQEDPAVDLHRTLSERREKASDTEQRVRLERLCTDLRDGARRALDWMPVGPDTAALQLYDVRNLVRIPVDQPCTEFGGVPPAAGADVDEEMLIYLIKESVSPGLWEGEHSLEITPSGELLVNTFPRVHAQMARFLRMLDAEFGRTLTVSLQVLAMPAARALEADNVTELLKHPDVARLDSAELKAQSCQQVSALTGVEHNVVAAFEDGKPVVKAVRDGLAVELRPVDTPSGTLLYGRVRFRVWKGKDEVQTAQGVIDLPRFAEFDLHVDRMAAMDTPVILGRAGPLPMEKGPGFLVLVAKVAAAGR